MASGVSAPGSAHDDTVATAQGAIFGGNLDGRKLRDARSPVRQLNGA
jgi:hypothetical protein